MHNAFLIGERIYLRPLSKEDVPQILTYLNDGEVARTLNWHRPLTKEAEEQWLDKVLVDERQTVLAIALKENDRFLGGTGLRPGLEKDRRAEFGIYIGAKEEWNKGYGTEATRLIVGYGFETLNLNRIYLHVFACNRGGIRAYEKAGFIKEGVLRQNAYFEGRYQDTLVMGLLREEWLAQGAEKQ
ncbi:MAG: GNAT family N-acetyltransferase [Planctomycetota bacterium]|nr:GNAT family N-acetyltransferase [Planctomycetota bacterium]